MVGYLDGTHRRTRVLPALGGSTTTGLISLVAVRSAVFKRLRLDKVAAPRNDDVDASFHSREDQKLEHLTNIFNARRRKAKTWINSFKSEKNNLSDAHTRACENLCGLSALMPRDTRKVHLWMELDLVAVFHEYLPCTLLWSDAVAPLEEECAIARELLVQEVEHNRECCHVRHTQPAHALRLRALIHSDLEEHLRGICQLGGLDKALTEGREHLALV